MKQEWTRRKILRFVFSVAPLDFAVLFLVGLIKCALTASGVFLTRNLFAAVEAAIGSGFTQEAFKWFLIYAGYLLAMSAFSFVFTRYIVQFKMLPRFEYQMIKRMHEKARRISGEQMQTPDIERLLQQCNGARQALFRYGEICITIVIAVLQTVAVTAAISAFDVWYLFFMPLSLILSLVRQWQQSRLLRKSMKEAAQLKREETAYEAAMLGEEACKETRVCNGGVLLMGKWENSRARRDDIEDEIASKTASLKFKLAPLELLGKAAGILVSGVLLWCKSISFPVFTAGVNAYETLLDSYQQLFEMLGHQKQYRTMLLPFFQYWDYPERTQTACDVPEDTTIELKQVSFRYPNQQNWAIRNVSLTLHPGDTLAIVGENGAGKTTLAKLLMGIYQPTEGSITYGGAPLKDIGEEQLHTVQSMVEQSFCRYKLTAEENITLGDVNKPVDKAFVHDAVQDILHRDDTDIPLGREFGGVDLSGGQWQRLACARGFYKSSKLLMLDEPTSALDALQEKRMYGEFTAQLKGKSGIIITHRLGMVQVSNQIIVLSHGEIAECGTHDELMGKNGFYASMWEGQAKQYAG